MFLGQMRLFALRWALYVRSRSANVARVSRENRHRPYTPFAINRASITNARGNDQQLRPRRRLRVSPTDTRSQQTGANRRYNWKHKAWRLNLLRRRPQMHRSERGAEMRHHAWRRSSRLAARSKRAVLASSISVN